MGTEPGLHRPSQLSRAPRGHGMRHHLLPLASPNLEHLLSCSGEAKALVTGLSTELWAPPPLPALTDPSGFHSDDQPRRAQKSCLFNNHLQLQVVNRESEL